MEKESDKSVGIIKGGLHVDERGVVSFVNDFDFMGADRFYTIKAHTTGKIRGWIAHKKQQKWFTALAGNLLVAVVAVDDWENPSKDLKIQCFTLSALQPGILRVPPGYAIATVMLSPDSLLGVFSSGKIETAVDDEYRFPEGMWVI